MTFKIKKNAVFDGFKLIKHIAPGGNSVVWLAENVQSNKKRAFKFFTNDGRPNRYQRFRDEIKVVQTSLTSIPGVVPILSSALPEDLSQDIAWYSMPVCTSLNDVVARMAFPKICEMFVSLARVLGNIHSRDIAHRDIKPDNILFFNDEACFSDFGLVDFPEKTGVTKSKERMGPKWNLPPEMGRDTLARDSKAADVYCFAKTLWMVLTENSQGFDGQYTSDKTIGLHSSSKHKEIYWKPIEILIAKCTSNTPIERPSAYEFADRLAEYLALINDWERLNAAQWEDIQTQMFGIARPVTAEWRQPSDIAHILELISTYPALSHCFLPDGGGNDIENARQGYEHGSVEIELWKGTADVVFPSRLLFEAFAEWPEWNYFRLEAQQTTALSTSTADTAINEDFVEISPENYVERRHWHSGTWVGKPNENKVRFITRYLSGAFIFAPKAGPFNRIDSYQGKVNAISASQQRIIIERLISNNQQNHLPTNAENQVRLQTPMLVTFAPYELHYLSKAQILDFLHACDALYAYQRKHNGESNTGTVNLGSELFLSKILDQKKDKAEIKLKRSIISLWDKCSPEQEAELMAIINAGRNISGFNRWEIDDLLTHLEKDTKSFTPDYYLPLLSTRNNYIKKGLNALKFEW